MANHGLFDYEALRRAVREKKGQLTLGQVELKTGVSKSTLCRFLDPTYQYSRYGYTSGNKRGHLGYAPSPDVVAQLCAWLGNPPETYIKNGGIPPKLEGLDLIDAVLVRDPNLTREQAIVLSDMLRAAYKSIVTLKETTQWLTASKSSPTRKVQTKSGSSPLKRPTR